MVEKKLNDLRNSDEYKTLLETRKKMTKPLAISMLVVYYVYILVIAFAPEVLAKPLGDGPTTMGIAVGLGIILFSFIVTGIAVHAANTELEPLTKKLHEKFGEGE